MAGVRATINFKPFTALLRERAFGFLPTLAKEFPEAEVYLVGGVVRDLLLGRESKDIDFVVRGAPIAKLEKFLKTIGVVHLVGKRFGVFKFVPHMDADLRRTHPSTRAKLGTGQGADSRGQSRTEASFAPFDIALPRTEHAWGTGGYRDVAVQSDPTLPIEEDLARRDFTVNAMAVCLSFRAQSRNPSHSKRKGSFGSLARARSLRMTSGVGMTLIDPFDGQNDLKKRIIRAVGEPKERFGEDYSRMLRALRFACELGFEIEKNTWGAMTKLMRHVNGTERSDLRGSGDPISSNRIVPFEIIARELLKSLVADPARALDLWDSSGAVKALIPELLPMKGCPQPQNYHTEGDVWVHTVLALEFLAGKQGRSFFGKLPEPFRMDDPVTPEAVVATLFHDIGKPPTMQTPERHGTDRIRFNEHDTVGGAMARTICERLHLSSVEGLGVDASRIEWLVSHHLVGVHGPIDKMKPTTIEKYFFRDVSLGKSLLAVMWADGTATITDENKPANDHAYAMVERIKNILKVRRLKRPGLPPPLINGNEVMEVFGLKPGQEIGKLLEIAREAQLDGKVKTKKEALVLLKHLRTNEL